MFYYIEDLDDKIDAKQDLFAFKNKVFDIKKGIYRDIEKTDYICRNTGYDAPDNIKDFTITNNINKTKIYIDEFLLPIIYNSGELLEGNIFMLHQTTTYTDVYLNKTKNICNLVLNKK